MIDSLINEQWAIIAVVFFGTIAYISWIRWRDQRWIENRFQKSQVIAMSFGVYCFGRSSESGKLSKSRGFLLLLKDRLFFRSRWSQFEMEVPGSAITSLYPATAHKGIDLHQSVMVIEFVTDTGEQDSAAFRVPYPPQWLNAIRQISPRLG